MGRWRACCLSAGRFRRTQIVFLHRANRPSERGESRARLFAIRAVRWRKEGKRKRHWKQARMEASALHKTLSRTRASALREFLWRARARRAGTLAPHRIVSQAKILWWARASALREHLSRARARRARAVPAAAQEALPLHRIL